MQATKHWTTRQLPGVKLRRTQSWKHHMYRCHRRARLQIGDMKPRKEIRTLKVIYITSQPQIVIRQYQQSPCFLRSLKVAPLSQAHFP